MAKFKLKYLLKEEAKRGRERGKKLQKKDALSREGWT